MAAVYAFGSAAELVAADALALIADAAAVGRSCSRSNWADGDCSRKSSPDTICNRVDTPIVPLADTENSWSLKEKKQK